MKLSYHREYYLNEDIDFGKYSGQSLKWIIDNDVNYVLWLLNKTDGFKINKYCYERISTVLNNHKEDHMYNR